MHYAKKYDILTLKIGKGRGFMTVIYIILAVIPVLLLLLAVVLLLPLSVRIVFKEQLVVYAGISFVKIKVFPPKENKQKKKKTNKKAHKKTDKKTTLAHEDAKTSSESADDKKTDMAKEQAKQEKKSIKDTLQLILDLVKSVFEVMGKRASLNIDELRVVVSRPDAADTAVQYALCQGIVSTILALASEFSKSKIKDENISVAPDFITEKSSLVADITMSVPSGALIFGIIKGYFINQTR